MAHTIQILDGATGTTLWAKTGEQSPVWQFNITQPEAVKAVYQEFLDAGTQILLTNTFAANGPEVSHSAFSVKEVVSAGTRLAKEVAGDRAKVALDIGPLSAMMEPYGEMTEKEVAQIYAEQIAAGMTEKPDYIWLETFFDLNVLEIVVQEAKRYGVPVFATMAFEAVGKTMFGNSVEDMVDTLSRYDLAGIGLNCNLTPDAAMPLLERFHACTDIPLIFKPNAGAPVIDEQGVVHSGLSAEQFVRDSLPARAYATYMGGCCGTPPAFIEALCKALQ